MRQILHVNSSFHAFFKSDDFVQKEILDIFAAISSASGGIGRHTTLRG